MTYSQQDLERAAVQFHDDPLGFVLFAYPWCQGGGPLEHARGPRRWQVRYLKSLQSRLLANKSKKNQVIREALCSGHGIGKSALLGMLISWVMSTSPDTRVILTAGTEAQLKTKTWPEITKWFEMSCFAHWFVVEETSIYSADTKRSRKWCVDRVTWNKARPEAFAGAHNEGKRLMVIFDEASQIDDTIWEVTNGALTDANTEIFWLVFGNPTRTEGEFFRCFNAKRNNWSAGEPLQIDSRDVEGTNVELFQEWVEDYGEDSDFVRVRVRGVFPRASALQFIPASFVYDASRREPYCEKDDPLIMALDVSRGGDDRSVFFFRRGDDAKSIPPIIIPGSEVRDSTKLIAKACALCDQFRPDYVFVDATGGSVGGPVADQLRRLGYNVMDVQFGGSSPSKEYINLRGYMWGRMRDALEHRLAIPHLEALEQDLTGPEFTHDKSDRVVLETKKDMKARGLGSPDIGDALAMTYAFIVKKKNRFTKAIAASGGAQATRAENFLVRTNRLNSERRGVRSR